MPHRPYVIDQMISAKAIAARVEELATDITEYFKGTDKLVVVGLLRGSFVFIADLVRELGLPVEVDFLEASSYGDSMRSSREVRILKDIRGEIAGRDVLVVEGADLTTPASIAALFDTDGDGLDSVAPLATPTSIRKAVVITADLTGDALIWYLVKSANINTTITEDNIVLEGEITKVGILEGLNTFSLLPFVIGNFA